jgi:hypothetical protein
MNSITDDTLDPANQLLLTEKSSAADDFDSPIKPQEAQPEPSFPAGTNLKNTSGFDHGGLND